MEIPITVTQRELLSLATELRVQIVDATIKRRIPQETVQILIEEIDEGRNYRNEDAQDPHMPAAFTAARTQPDNTDNPHDGYLNTLPEPSDPQEEVEVVAESNTLRAILPTVDRQDKIEAILDPGCQVVAMSEEVCNALAIAMTRASDLVWSRPTEESIKLLGSRRTLSSLSVKSPFIFRYTYSAHPHTTSS